MRFLFLLILFFFAETCSAGVHPNGYWYGDDAAREHQFDGWLASSLADFFVKERATTIGDLGCGKADYVKVLLAYQFDCEGYDGNPDTVSLSDGLAKVADLSAPLDFGKTFDWILALEVAEHIPKPFETTFIENLHRHNTRGIVISWAVKGQGGYGHFNEQNNDYVKALFKKYGYENDIEAENALRSNASLWWFKHSLMVFRRIL